MHRRTFFSLAFFTVILLVLGGCASDPVIDVESYLPSEHDTLAYDDDDHERENPFRCSENTFGIQYRVCVRNPEKSTSDGTLVLYTLESLTSSGYEKKWIIKRKWVGIIPGTYTANMPSPTEATDALRKAVNEYAAK